MRPDVEHHIEVQKRRGIGSEAGYDSYFGMHPSADAITNTVINDLISNLKNAKAIETVIRSYLDRKNSRGELMLGKLFEELLVRYRSEVPVQPTQELLDALFQIGEEVLAIEKNDDLFIPSPRSQIGFLIKTMLVAWGTKTAGTKLIEAFKKCDSPAFLADVYVDRGREFGIFKSDTPVSPLISQNDYSKLGKILLTRIRVAAKNGSLKQSPFFFDIVRSWSKLDKPITAKRWLSAGMLESAKFLAKAGKGLVNYTVGTSKRVYSMHEKPDESLYDLRIIADAGMKYAKDPTLTSDEQNLVAELVRGSNEILGGKSTRSANSKKAKSR